MGPTMRSFRLPEDGVAAHAVDFRGGREDDPLLRFGAHADDLQVLFEIELEGPEGLAEVVGRLGDSGEGKNRVASRYGLSHPVVGGEDVSLGEGEVRVSVVFFEVHAGKVEGVHLPVRPVQDAFDEMGSDEAVGPENQYVHFLKPPNAVLSFLERRADCAPCSISRSSATRAGGAGRASAIPAGSPPREFCRGTRRLLQVLPRTGRGGSGGSPFLFLPSGAIGRGPCPGASRRPGTPQAGLSI